MNGKFDLFGLTIRFLVGGSLVVLVTLLARTRSPQLAGLAVLFPAVTLVAYYFLITTLGPQQVRPIVAFSLYSLPAVVAFLAALFLALSRYSVIPSLGLAFTAWLLMAALLLTVDARFEFFSRWQ